MCSRNTVRGSSHISFFCDSLKLQTLYCLLKSNAGIWTRLFAHVFFCLWLVIGTYILPGFFFSVICWSYLRTEISVSLSIGNKLYSRQHILYFSFLWKPLCWCYLGTALDLPSSSSPAMLVYYTWTFDKNRFIFSLYQKEAGIYFLF